tara:strand:+ start:239 stop:679 length:441 start_codon:yes stop_codon:yes gene_type:complete
MIVRRCSQGHRVRIYRNTTPGMTRIKKYSDDSTETLTYPSSYNYFVEVDDSVEKKTNSFKTAEEFYNAECAKKHADPHGRLIIGGHHLINGVATSQSEYPTADNSKSEIKSFYDMRNVGYSTGDTKAVLLNKIKVNDFTGAKTLEK